MSETPEAPQPDPESRAMVLLIAGLSAGALPMLAIGLAAQHFLERRAFWLCIIGIAVVAIATIHILRKTGRATSQLWASAQLGIAMGILITFKAQT